MLAALAGGGALAADDVVLERAVVPSSKRPQGEVRLIGRDGRVVVQTVLNSKVLRRVAGAIAEKEQSNWPSGRQGSEDAARYIAALADMAMQIQQQDRTDEGRRRSMCIEYTDTDGEVRVTFTGARVETGPEGLALVAQTDPRQVMEPSTEYYERNRLLIVADAFGLDSPGAAELIASAGKRIE